ncbi:MAG: NADH-quinone oxidoreductase subunit NuoE [Caldisericia bacterium]|nr:NADH-quinone oxidoreductase subunit NuoE [Caldisericia bacterium]
MDQCSEKTNTQGALETASEEQMELLNSILVKYKKKPGSLITILQKVQGVFGYLPLDVLKYISKETGIKSPIIYGVATFYTQYRLKPVGKYLILLCKGTACHVNGANEIEITVCDELNIKNGETTSDGLFTLNNVACLGCCSLSPVMMINSETYAKLTPKKTRKILKELRKKNQNSENEEK